MARISIDKREQISEIGNMINVYYGEIHLLQEPEIFARCFTKMHQKRQQKVQNCKNEKDKYASLLAGALLKYGLEQQGFGYQDVVLEEDIHGKPFLSKPEGVFFNISHSGDVVVCVFSNKNIGIDIENSHRMLFNKKVSLERVAKKCFSVQEYSLYADSNQKEELFLKYWTRKESYSKADGRGIGMDFSKIDVWSEEIEKDFWSGWLTEDTYLSIYQPNIVLEKIIFEEIQLF